VAPMAEQISDNRPKVDLCEVHNRVDHVWPTQNGLCSSWSLFCNSETLEWGLRPFRDIALGGS